MKRQKLYTERVVMDIKQKSLAIGGNFRVCFDDGWIPVCVIETPGYNTVIARFVGTDDYETYLYSIRQYSKTPKKYALN